MAQERAAIRRQEIRPRLAAGRATVATRVFLERFSAGDRLTVDARVLDPSGRAVARVGQAVRGAAGPLPVALSVGVPEPRLWHFDQPNVYRLAVEVQDATGAVLDRLEESFGLRTLEIRDRDLWVSGERVRLTRDHPSRGVAPGGPRGDPRDDEGRLRDDLKALQVTLTRPVHYPQHPYVLDYADEYRTLPHIAVLQVNG